MEQLSLLSPIQMKSHSDKIRTLGVAKFCHQYLNSFKIAPTYTLSVNPQSGLATKYKDRYRSLFKILIDFILEDREYLKLTGKSIGNMGYLKFSINHNTDNLVKALLDNPDMLHATETFGDLNRPEIVTLNFVESVQLFSVLPVEFLKEFPNHHPPKVPVIPRSILNRSQVTFLRFSNKNVCDYFFKLIPSQDILPKLVSIANRLEDLDRRSVTMTELGLSVFAGIRLGELYQDLHEVNHLIEFTTQLIKSYYYFNTTRPVKGSPNYLVHFMKTHAFKPLLKEVSSWRP